MQVLEVVFRGEESCRQHINSIRLENVWHTKADARIAELELLSAQECLTQAVEDARRMRERDQKQDAKVWSTLAVESSYTSTDESLRIHERLVRHYEERARQKRQVARFAVEALGSPSVAG